MQTDPEEVPPIMAWEVEAALRKMKNGKEAGTDQVNIETLTAGDETIAKQLAKLYIKYMTERRIPKTWMEANMVVFFKKGNRKDSNNYRPICLLANMYKLFTKIITTRLERKLYNIIYNSVCALRHKHINSSANAQLNAAQTAGMKGSHWTTWMVGPDILFSIYQCYCWRFLHEVAP